MTKQSPSKWRKWYRCWDQVILGVAGLLLVLAVWELAAVMEWINPIILSSPTLVFESAKQQFTDGSLWIHLRLTFIEFIVAFALASVIGVLIGLIMGWYRKVEYSLDPFVWVLYSSPLIGFYPLFIVWFGLGFTTVVLIAFLMSVVPIVINTMTGVKSTNLSLIRAARSFGASDRQVLFKVALPSALPMIVGGFRIGVERALIGVIVGEMFTSTKGIGFLISYYGSRIQTANLLVAVVFVVMFGLLLTQTLRLVEVKLQKANH